ncbi:DUF5682 family protein [Calothrix rhizosoleniae]|uniref:DUF5682 family protein n=1 Tax=Calothrix rhizosoleniae TaxID=888997 RepID=UPI000B4A4BAC|nr:DUF5682 family protein [Calothrix rhizosoleniae]
MTVHIFGIRHHGPGSSRSLRRALEELQPDTILVEGPPDAEAVLPLLTSPAMKPPVALLIYIPSKPHHCVYYPFAIFSPEWQALDYGLTHNIPVRFMDLPQTHRLAFASQNETQPDTDEGFEDTPQIDPLLALAEVAGYSDTERWWEHLVEQRGDSVDLFTAILSAMTAVREEIPPRKNPIEAQREAYMRQTIRSAQKAGASKIAVVCGAWHAPALQDMPPAKEDIALLKGLPKTKVEATWIPWNYSRLSYKSGYGAGVESPGWYHHLWSTQCRDNRHSMISIGWMTRVAHLLREQDLEASSAHVIEAVRLAESLAALRDRPLPGLLELNEATQTVMCFGRDLPMELIHDKLIVGERLGQVPPDTPMLPLQQDFFRQQKRLRMTADGTEKILDLDLRKKNDLERSHLLHRLHILDVPWGQLQQTGGKKGTFHELWRLQWQPELAVSLIEAGIWGNRVEDAAIHKACDLSNQSPELPTLTTLLNQVILSDLPDAVAYVMSNLENAAALAQDVTHLMAALPPIANVMRYGNVRQTDTAMVSHVVNGLVTRICIGLPSACGSLDDNAAGVMYENMMKVNGAIALLSNQEHLRLWQQVLTQIANNRTIHNLLIGRCCRLLLDAGIFDIEETAQRMGFALSTASEPSQAAAWIEGFLKGSGLLLLHDEILWQVLDDWVIGLSADSFITLLPLLRRTFATFSSPEKRQMGEKVKQGNRDRVKSHTVEGSEFNQENAAVVLPTITQLLGI